MAILITGAAGFIGFHVAARLLDEGQRVIGVDNMNDYYEVSLKEARLAQLEKRPGFRFRRLDVADREDMLRLATEFPEITGVVHLAAIAGVRHSLTDPYSYVSANVMGHVVMLELARRLDRLKHFVYASSAAVYGDEGGISTLEDRADRPTSIYAATKRADELISHTYAHLYGLPATGLRFFTAYGPWGRPDMAAFIFARTIFAGEAIQVFNHGEMWRDFTYVDDIVAGVLAALDRPPSGTPPHAVYNLGKGHTEKLTDFIAALETAIGRKAEKCFEPMQPGDVVESLADIELSRRDLGYDPKTPIEVGVPRSIAWYRDYYGV
jgi:UDP-glucuronate 4-epimerase